jgi:uncharacterized protein YecT (DUF1311 family)
MTLAIVLVRGVVSMLKRSIGLVIVLASVTGVACSQTATKSKPCGDCESQAEMNGCFAKEAQEADARLNATYKKLLSKIKDNKVAVAKAVAAERAWVTFRDAQLAALWPVGSDAELQSLGTVHPMCYAMERKAMTEERIKQLRQQMKSEEGDCASLAIRGTWNQLRPGGVYAY